MTGCARGTSSSLFAVTGGIAEFCRALAYSVICASDRCVQRWMTPLHSPLHAPKAVSQHAFRTSEKDNAACADAFCREGRIHVMAFHDNLSTTRCERSVYSRVPVSVQAVTNPEERPAEHGRCFLSKPSCADWQSQYLVRAHPCPLHACIAHWRAWV